MNKALDAKEQAVFPAQVAVAYLQIGDRDAFNRNVDAACTGSSYGNYGIVHELIRQGLLDDAANIAEMAKLPDERADRFETLAIEMAKAGRSTDYEKYIEKAAGETSAAITATTQPEDREYLAYLLCRTEIEAGDYDRVLKSIDGLKAQHALTLYAEIAAARFKAGDTAEYGKMIDRAVKLASSDRYASCQAIGKAMALANDELRVQQARVAMGRRSVEIEFFLERARMFAETGDVKNALQCLKQADDSIAKDDAPDWASVPSQVSHTAVMELLAKAGKDDAALAMVPNLKSALRVDSPAEPEMTYPLIAAAQAAGGRITAARATMDKIPDPAKRESNVPEVCRAAAEAGQPLDDIRVWIDSFQKPLNRADADIRVAYALIKRQKGK